MAMNIMNTTELVQDSPWALIDQSFIWHKRRSIRLACTATNEWWKGKLAELEPEHAPLARVWVGEENKAKYMWEMVAKRFCNKLEADATLKLCRECEQEPEIWCSCCKHGSGYCEGCAIDFVGECARDCETCAPAMLDAQFTPRNSHWWGSCNNKVECGCHSHIHIECCIECGAELDVRIDVFWD
jgi:hypothetical protein